jgi:hypothetical protein
MSLTKNTQEFPNKITERNIIILISNVLRNVHSNESAAVKRISRKTGIEIRTIESWFQARNTPNAKNLLLLMRHYPEMREAVMKITRNSIDEHITFDNKSAKKVGKQTGNNFDPFQVYRVIFDPINSVADSRKISDLNLRQLWFLNEIHNGSNPNSESIQARWPVSKEIAKRDIAKLRRLKLICFVGAKKNGRYELV